MSVGVTHPKRSCWCSSPDVAIYSEKQSLDSQKVIHGEIQISAKTSQRTPKGVLLKIEQHLKISLTMHILNTATSQGCHLPPHSPKPSPSPEGSHPSHLTEDLFISLPPITQRVPFQRKPIYPAWSLFTPIRPRKPCSPRASLNRQRRGEAVSRDV